MSREDYSQFNQRFLRTDYRNLDPNRPRKVGIYARVSTQHEAQIHALKNQLQWYEEQIKKHPNWTVVDYYVDEGISGTQARKRPNFLRMIGDAEDGKIDLIVTREVSRFSRNTKETLEYTQNLESIGVEVYFISQELWSMTEHGKQGLYFLAYFAEKESQSTSERVKAGQAISRDNKELYGNGNILGYELVKREDKSNTYAIIPEEAETVRMIFDLYLDNYGFTKIAHILTERRRKNASGIIKWNAQNIRRIIQNATYTGRIGYNKSRSSGFLTQKRINNLDIYSFEYAAGDFEPIITWEQWERAQEVRESKTTRTSNGKDVHIVGKQVSRDIWVQKLRCPCGCGFRRDKWYTYANGSHSYGYTCYKQLNIGSKKSREKTGLDTDGFCDTPMIAAWKMDCMVQEVMQQLWTDQNESLQIAIELVKQFYKEADKDKQVNRATIQKQIDRLKKRISGYVEMRADGDLSKEEYTAKRSQAEEEICQLQAELAEPEEANSAERDAKLNSIIETLKSLVQTEGGKVDDNLIKHFIAKVVPVGNNAFEWYIDLDKKHHAKAVLSTTGRKNNSTIKLEEIFEISPSLSRILPLFQNSPLSATSHRLLSRVNFPTAMPPLFGGAAFLHTTKRSRPIRYRMGLLVIWNYTPKRIQIRM